MSGSAVLLALVLQLSSPLPEALRGAWSVDLSARADEPYIKSMTLDLQSDGRLAGDFYDSEIEGGRWTASRGRLCVSFRTTDGVGPYHTTACLDGDRVEGQTWAEHRSFLFLWTAERPAGADAAR
ncbi:MAG: hypothetical protein ACT6TH_08030 [Brevundimonas sp.]|uniref:hypothetical protein n=1 Tax=Brevundimonas sp. TaxID=1871086 RepID=UPI0040337EDB